MCDIPKAAGSPHRSEEKKALHPHRNLLEASARVITYTAEWRNDTCFHIFSYFPSPNCNLESISEAIEMLVALSMFLGWLSLLAVLVQFASHLEQPSIYSELFSVFKELSFCVCFESILVSRRHPLQLNTFF